MAWAVIDGAVADWIGSLPICHELDCCNRVDLNVLDGGIMKFKNAVGWSETEKQRLGLNVDSCVLPNGDIEYYLCAKHMGQANKQLAESPKVRPC